MSHAAARRRASYPLVILVNELAKELLVCGQKVLHGQPRARGASPHLERLERIAGHVEHIGVDVSEKCPELWAVDEGASELLATDAFPQHLAIDERNVVVLVAACQQWPRPRGTYPLTRFSNMAGCLSRYSTMGFREKTVRRSRPVKKTVTHLRDCGVGIQHFARRQTASAHLKLHLGQVKRKVQKQIAGKRRLGKLHNLLGLCHIFCARQQAARAQGGYLRLAVLP